MTGRRASSERERGAARAGGRPRRWIAPAAWTAQLALILCAADGSTGQAADTATKAPTNPGDIALGEYLSAECVTCHRLNGDYDGIPPIIGWPSEHFFAVMLEYRHKKRPNPVMQTVTSNLTDEEIGALAAYFAQLTPQ